MKTFHTFQVIMQPHRRFEALAVVFVKFKTILHEISAQFSIKNVSWSAFEDYEKNLFATFLFRMKQNFVRFPFTENNNYLSLWCRALMLRKVIRDEKEILSTTLSCVVQNLVNYREDWIMHSLLLLRILKIHPK